MRNQIHKYRNHYPSSSGILDPEFDTDGLVLTEMGIGYNYGYAIAIQPDGKIIVAGEAAWDFALARYNLDGSLDTSFHSGGRVTTGFNSIYDNGYAIALQQGGKIVVAGYTSIEMSYLFAIARYK